MAEEVLMVLTSWPSLEEARVAARALVGEGLAASGKIFGGVESIDSWEGKVESTMEVVVLFQTTMGSYPNFERRVMSLHPYAIPVVVAMRVAEGLPSYLRWVEDRCR